MSEPYLCDETVNINEDVVTQTENDYRKCESRNEQNPVLRDGKRILTIECKDNPTKNIVDDSTFSLLVNAEITSWREKTLTPEEKKQRPAIYPPPEVMQAIYQSVLKKLLDTSDAKPGTKAKERQKFLKNCNGIQVKVTAKCNKKVKPTGKWRP